MMPIKEPLSLLVLCGRNWFALFPQSVHRIKRENITVIIETWGTRIFARMNETCAIRIVRKVLSFYVNVTWITKKVMVVFLFSNAASTKCHYWALSEKPGAQLHQLREHFFFLYLLYYIITFLTLLNIINFMTFLLHLLIVLGIHCGHVMSSVNLKGTGSYIW